MVTPYGFVIRSDQNDSENWLCRYTEDRKEDRTILFIYSQTGQLEHILINDFGKAEEEWTFYGMDCRMTVEDWVKEQSAVIFGHNMVLFGTGIGFEKLEIGKISWGCYMRYRKPEGRICYGSRNDFCDRISSICFRGRKNI